jgi:hypothetical protein
LKFKKRGNQKVLALAAVLLTACAVLIGVFAVGRNKVLVEPAPDALPAPPKAERTIEIPDNIYIFTEPLIESAVRLMLGKDEYEPILRAELKDVTEIYIFGDQAIATREEYRELSPQYHYATTNHGIIETLDDLREMENLIELRLMAIDSLSDISPLSQNIKLEWIELQICNITDLSPLENLPLVSIRLYNIPVADFSDFENMQSLTRLILRDTPLTSLTQLGTKPNVTFLDLQFAFEISNLDGIENFPALRELCFDHTEITDFSPLNGLSNLNSIRIDDDMEQYLHTLDRDDISIEVIYNRIIAGEAFAHRNRQ